MLKSRKSYEYKHNQQYNPNNVFMKEINQIVYKRNYFGIINSKCTVTANNNDHHKVKKYFFHIFVVS